MARRIWLEMPNDEELKELVESAILKDGKEAPNPTKQLQAVGGRPLTLKEQVLKILNHEKVKRNLNSFEKETWEEANDFEIESDNELDLSGYEVEDMEEEILPEKDNITDVAANEPEAEDPPAEPVDPPAPAE